MAFEQEQQAALHLLRGIENGSLSTTQAVHLIDEADPALVYFITTWLRQTYARHAAAEGVLGRLAELSAHRSVKAKLEEGKIDSLITWFEDEYEYRDLGAVDFIALIVDKLEG